MEPTTVEQPKVEESVIPKWRKPEAALVHWKNEIKREHVIILQEIAFGMSYKEIAVKHGTTEQYIKNMMLRIRKHLGSMTTIETIVMCLRAGVIE